MKICRSGNPLTQTVVTLALLIGAITVQAATNGFIVPAFRSTANSESGYWEIFTVPSGAPGNLPDQPGATTDAVLTQTNTSAFVTGSGNIYNTSVSSFELADTTPYALGTVVLQTRTVGSELDYNSVSLIYSNETGSHILAPLFRYELSRVVIPGQGSGVSSLWQWNLSGLGVSNYTVVFNAAGPHLSFDSMTLDTAEQFGAAFPEQPFSVQSAVADLARWMYPHNASPANRASASTFASFGSTGTYDTRNGQFLLGWNTSNAIPAGLGATNYLLRSARVTLTISRDLAYAYSGILRDYRTYFPTNDPQHLAPAGSNCPVELFGAGFRGGFTALTFPQDGPFASSGSAYYTNRNAYAAGFDINGALVDVSNNVGDDGTNEIASPFEVAPFAVGQTTNVAEGELMPAGSRLTFDLNLDDPLIYGYVQQALNDGGIRLVASSLIRPNFPSGSPNYPDFYTPFSLVAETNEYPLLEIEGGIVRPGLDSDADGLPDDWENLCFGTLAQGADADADGDGASNLAEYQALTSPTSADSVFRLLSVSPAGDGTEVRFSIAPGHQYAVQWSDDFLNWQTVTNPALVSSSAWLSKSDTNATYPAPVFAAWKDTNTPAPQRFYRVEAR